MSKTQLWTALLGAAICLSSAHIGRAAPQSAPFAWGVTGHPGVQEGYPRETLRAQLDLVREAGMRWYRCDWPQSIFDKTPEFYDELLREAKKRNLKILPILFPTVALDGSVSNAEIRVRSAAYARAVAGKYRGRVTHWELANELDNFSILQKGDTTRKGEPYLFGAPDGDSVEHYEEARYQRILALLRGLSEGVKAADPKALTMINAAGWLHTGFFDRLISEDKVPFDILAWHWYSDMGDMTKVRGTVNVFDRLKSYRKPIWITEMNRRSANMGGEETERAAYLLQAGRQMQTLGAKAFFAYELLDEPYFGAENPESYYGLVQVAKNDKGVWIPAARKPSFSAMQQLTGAKK